jgi:hypothetical protein
MANKNTPANVAASGRTGDLRSAGASGLNLDGVAPVQLGFSAFLEQHESGPGS